MSYLVRKNSFETVQDALPQLTIGVLLAAVQLFFVSGDDVDKRVDKRGEVATGVVTLLGRPLNY